MADTLSQFLSGFLTPTGLTGGGANNLDGIPTVGVDVSSGKGLRAMVVTGGNVSFYLLESGSGNSSPATIRPADYNASTNAKQWTKQTFT